MKATLVKVDVVSADLGKTAKHIFDLAEGGSLLEPGLVWVFDVAQRLDRGRRDLRFWRPEIEARAKGKPGAIRSLEIDEVINRILPEGRTSLFPGELDLLWQLRPCRRFNLKKRLTRRNADPGPYTREELVAFLKRRWLGACYNRPRWQKASMIPARKRRPSSPCGTPTATDRNSRSEPDDGTPEHQIPENN